MRSHSTTILAILVLLFGCSWLFFEAEIREFIGWPKKEEVLEEVEGERSGEKPKQISSDPKDVPDRSEKDVEPTKEEIIQRIVYQRYPDLPETPFAERFPSPVEIPTEAYPGRVQSRAGVSFYERSGAAILSASRVKEGGFVRPEKVLPDGELLVSSLAGKNMTATVAISDTNFTELIEEMYENALRRAQERIVEMRDVDASELRSNTRLFRRLSEAPSVWSEEPMDPFLEEALFAKLDPENYTIRGHYELGRKRIQTSERFNVYSVTLLLVEGRDNGFGPYFWQVQALESSGKVADWLGLPE